LENVEKGQQMAAAESRKRYNEKIDELKDPKLGSGGGANVNAFGKLQHVMQKEE
jgi:hypothetical protein